MPSATSDDSGDGGAGTAQVVATSITIFIAIIVPVSIYVSILVPHWFPCCARALLAPNCRGRARADEAARA